MAGRLRTKTKQLVEPLKALIDLKFIIPAIFLIASLIGNGVQCGTSAIARFKLGRARNALELALAKQRNLKAHKAVAEYKAVRRVTDPKILKNDNDYKKLEEAAKKSGKELKKIRNKVGNMTITGVKNELNKELGIREGDSKELPPEPVCPPCKCGDDNG